jgi:LPXTG-motif cell wall-anchored protein
MKYVLIIIGIILSVMGFVQGYRYIFDFNTLTMYGKGYVTGTIVLLILGLALIIAGFFIRKKR